MGALAVSKSWKRKKRNKERETKNIQSGGLGRTHLQKLAD